MAKLSDARVRTVTKPGLHGDGGGLYLHVRASGSRSWVQRITIDGRRRDIGLGAYPAVGLARARLLAAANRAAVAEGRDPLSERRRSQVPTFREAALRVHEANRPRWRNGKHVVNWIGSLERHAFPALGAMPVDRIEGRDVLAVLAPIWGVRMETARRVRQRIRMVLRWCLAHGYVERNVAGEAIDGALPAMPRVRSHFRALAYEEVPAALAVVEGSAASLSAKLCLRFSVLTAARSGEARGAVWEEIDPGRREWRIPGIRMKAGVEHRVPLSDAALDALARAKPLRDGSGLVFPSPRKPGRPLSDMTLTKLLRDTRLADRATVHGFRTSFRNWAAECTDAPHAAMELSLAHAVGSAVERAYARSDLLEKRRVLMEQWAAFATGTGAPPADA